MEKIVNEILREEVYYEKLDNGLDIYFMPKKGFTKKFAVLATNYGSNELEFIPINGTEKIRVNEGIAHFLEHKMFEQPGGGNAFDKFSKLGANANAYTNFTMTAYLFSCTDNFYENLEHLIDYVQTPYFTEENVEKEKGIIEQEIRMYDDDPFFKMYDGIIYNSFIKHPIKYPIAGTVKSVKSTTKEDLYNCYNTFYHPSNMFLVITRNVDPKETINLIKINQEKKKFDKFTGIEIKEYDEPNKVEKKEETTTMDIEISKLGIGYKIDCSKIDKSIADIKSYISLLFD